MTGPYDRDYVERRFRVGHRHVEIGLKQIYVEVAVSRLRSGLQRVLQSHWPVGGDFAELTATMRSVSTLLDLEVAIIQDAYETATNERLVRAERLAAIGRVAGGIAHELRNPLNVMRTSIYFLRNTKSALPEKIAEHLQRIERQVALCDSVITALSEFAKLPLPNLQPLLVLDCLKTAVPSDRWSSLRIVAKGSKFSVFIDDKPLFDVEDSTFADAGKVGLWTKADSVTAFDDFTVKSLDEASP